MNTFSRYIARFVIVLGLIVVSKADAAPTVPPPTPPGLTPVHYVTPDGAHVYPFITWENAAKDIQSAVDASSAGDTVLVTNGIYDAGMRVTPGYSSMNRLVITNDITVQSINGPEGTFIVGAADPITGGNGSIAVRGVYMSVGKLIGFTITDGHTQNSGDYDYDLSGGGINMRFGNGIVSNCVLAGNSARFGGGSISGRLKNCVIIQNSAYSGGGCIYGELDNCTMLCNSASHIGGGSVGGRLNNCIISGNMAGNAGGGSSSGILNNCTISNNTAGYAGGSHYGTLNGCVIMGNTAETGGGGAVFGVLKNCTISGNTAKMFGGGVGYCVLLNCIVYSNTVGSFENNWYDDGTFDNGPHFSYCCTMPEPGGMGNITNAPLFLDPDNGDFRLLATSPCIDAGTNGLVTTTTDLDGNERIIDGDFDGTATVDMGAYEFNAQEIPVDIMVPTISLGSKGRTPVAVITTEDFDASTIDPSSIRFAGAPPVHNVLEDVDGDGDIDLKLHVLTQDLEIDPDDTEAMLIGQNYSGTLVVGTSPIKIVPANK